jgi:hypothetical protein
MTRVTRGWRRLLRLRFGRTESDVDDEVRFLANPTIYIHYLS